MASKVKVAIVFILVTLVPTARATSDDQVRLDFPAFDTLQAAPVWTSRYLRSTESLTTTDEGNGKERGFFSEILAKLGLERGHHDNVSLLMKESKTVLPKKESEVVNALKEESEKVKVPKEKSKDKLSVDEAVKKWWASVINFVFRKDDEVKRLVKNVNDIDDITPITTTLETKHFQRWFDMRRSAEDIHDLLGLPKGPELLKSPLVWIWVEYAIWIGQISKNPMDTIIDFEKMFGNNVAVAKIFEDVDKVNSFWMSANMARLRKYFLRHWLTSDLDLRQLRTDLENAKFAEKSILYYEKQYKYYRSEEPEVAGH